MSDKGLTQKDVEKMFRQYYGNNYDKAMKNSELGVKRAKLKFRKKYPNADISKFDFSATVEKTGDIEETSVSYKINEDEGYDITSDTFKRLYSDALYWTPRIWDTDGTVQPFVLAPNSLPYNVKKFIIYVNDKVSFWSNFEALSTS